MRSCPDARSRPYIPKWKGIEKYKGIIHHSSLWPETPVDMKGKRVAVIGAGELPVTGHERAY